jgi:hypothetical protein
MDIEAVRAKLIAILTDEDVATYGVGAHDGDIAKMLQDVATLVRRLVMLDSERDDL